MSEPSPEAYARWKRAAYPFCTLCHGNGYAFFVDHPPLNLPVSSDPVPADLVMRKVVGACTCTERNTG